MSKHLCTYMHICEKKAKIGKMSVTLNVNTKFDDESDSFYSFGQSASESIDFDDISNIDEDNADTNELDLESDTISSVQSQDPQLSDSKKTCARSVLPKLPYEDHPNSALNRVLSAKCRYEVAQSKTGCKMPDLKLFDMNAVEKKPNIEALQKFAFTEIWVETQQNKPKQNRSPHGVFQTAMNTYLQKDEIDNFDKLTLQEQQKGNRSEHSFVKPHKSSNAPTNCLETIPEVEPYISPFEDMPTVPEMKDESGIKYVTVPAGFDLTNLVEYNNPNHWHRRATTRYDTHP